MRIRVAVLLVLAALVVTACGSGSGGDAAIGTVRRSGTVPLKIVTAGNAAVALASVSINGQGPFRFIVDTGASQSVLDTAVARRVGLHAGGAVQRLSGVGCQTKAGTATVSRWAVSGFALPSDRVDVLKLAIGRRRAGQPRIDGLLGSDVLSRFGVAAIDYQAGRLRLGAAAVKLSTARATAVPIRVVQGKHAVLAVAPVKIRGHGPYGFVVDSGATSSVVGSGVAAKLGLPVSSAGQQASGIACQTKSSVVKIGHWKVGSTMLPGQRVAKIKLPGQLRNNGIRGLLGSGTLKSFGTVAIDYSRQRLLLAPRLTTPHGGTSSMAIEHAHGSTVAVVHVKIDGKGPYPFALDTGASKSVVDTAVAHRVGLPTTGQTANISGVVAGRNVHVDRVSRWSVGGVSLPAANVASVTLPHTSGMGAVQGLLGSDVLRHFAKVAIDYKHSRLELGQAASPPPSPHTVTLSEVTSSGTTELLAPVTISGKGPMGFTLDTGAAHTVIERALAGRLGLRLTGKAAAVQGVVAGSAAPLVALKRWSLGSVQLPPISAAAVRMHLGPSVGLLGSDVLSHFGVVTIDYRKQQLLLP